jgi:putative tryptophan/tyrosine transport system substrate-binding protein
MRRRDFIILLAGAMGGRPSAVRAQQKAMPVIGFLGFGSPTPNAPFLAVFPQGLSETGYVEGQNVAIERRYTEGRADRLPALAADLVDRKVDVIVAAGGTALAAKKATSTIPIVFAVGTDPVADGLVASLARPGGNLTGISAFNLKLMPKRLELLSELVPQARVLALLAEPNIPITEPMIRDVQEAARAKGVQLQILEANSESEIDAAFATLVQLQVGGLLVGPAPSFSIRREQIFALASRHAVPAMYDTRLYVAAGGLVSYGPSLAGMWRQVGIYVGKILNGAKPADLPVQQPTTFELVINLNTAKALGLTIPPSILARADEVIE